jgi:molybdopterin molybdotransferase
VYLLESLELSKSFTTLPHYNYNMISVAEAYSKVLSHVLPFQKENVALSDAVGRVLAEPVLADRDLPPFHRVMMDGVALRWEELDKGRRQFRIAGIRGAGDPAASLTDSEACMEVMTGAVLPEGTNTVVRYEDLAISGGVATVTAEKIARGEAIHFRSADAQKNDILLEPGIRIVPAEIAVLASIGKAKVEVFRFPSTAIVSTGDELVSVHETPLPHQIRTSNSFALQAALTEIHCKANLFHITDQQDALLERLAPILERHELIILSGGVSKGKFDLVPGVLATLGIQKVFHLVSQKPGKPFWYGHSGEKAVFALPGNPVSTYLCFYRYIRPWLLKSMMCSYSFPSAILAIDFTFSPPLTYFLQVKIRNVEGKLMAHPLVGGGSGDFANLKDVDGFLELPADRALFKAGEVFSFIPFR